MILCAAGEEALLEGVKNEIPAACVIRYVVAYEGRKGWWNVALPKFYSLLSALVEVLSVLSRKEVARRAVQEKK